MENQVVINPRMLLFAMLSLVKYVKQGEETFGVMDLLRKRFGKKIDFIYFDEEHIRSMFSRDPFMRTLSNPGVAGHSSAIRPEYEIERDEEMDYFFRREVEDEKEREFLMKEVVPVIREYYEKLPGGKERLWEMERKNTTEQNEKLGI